MPMSEADWEAFEAPQKPRDFSVRSSGAISVRKALLRAQGGLCALCGLPITGFIRNVDHVVPKARGGIDRIGNLVIAHPSCNTAKGGRLPTGCEVIWLLAVNNRLGVEPSKW